MKKQLNNSGAEVVEVICRRLSLSLNIFEKSDSYGVLRYCPIRTFVQVMKELTTFA
jgi:hypothetical protein